MHCTCINKNKSDQRGVDPWSRRGCNGGLTATGVLSRILSRSSMSQGVFSHCHRVCSSMSRIVRLHGFRRSREGLSRGILCINHGIAIDRVLCTVVPVPVGSCVGT